MIIVQVAPSVLEMLHKRTGGLIMARSPRRPKEHNAFDFEEVETPKPATSADTALAKRASKLAFNPTLIDVHAVTHPLSSTRPEIVISNSPEKPSADEGEEAILPPHLHLDSC